MFEVFIIACTAMLMAYCLGALTLIVFYLKALGKPLMPAVVGGIGDILFMLSAIWRLLAEPFGPEDPRVWIATVAFLLSAISFSVIHRVLEKANNITKQDL